MSGTTRRKPGELGLFVAGYESWLLALGYTPATVRNKLKELGQLGRWMATQGIGAAQLDAGRVGEFLAARRAAGCRRVPVLRSFAPLLGYLRDEGVITASPAELPTPLEVLVSRYRSWLVTERALAPATVLRYENLAHRFLAGHVQPDGARAVQVEDLSGAAVTAFLLAECARVSVGSAKGRVAELRALLRFLYLQGMTPRFLAAAVPPVAGWRDTTVPAGMTASDMERLLASCDRSAAAGLRNYAILMLLARLGLRSAEVARLELGDRNLAVDTVSGGREEAECWQLPVQLTWRSGDPVAESRTRTWRASPTADHLPIRHRYRRSHSGVVVGLLERDGPAEAVSASVHR